MSAGRFRLGHAEGRDWKAVCAQILAQLDQPQEAETLGLLYLSDHFAADIDDIHDFLRERTGVPHWVGTTGIGICATGREYFDTPAIAAMTGRVPLDAMRFLDTARRGASRFIAAERDWLTAAGAPFGIVHADPRDPALTATLTALTDEAQAFLVGGLTSSRGRHGQIADRISEGHLSGVLLSPDVAVATGLSQGCTPIGPRRRITRAEANIIAEIDERPALDVLREDIGELLARDLNRIAGYIFAALPVTGSDSQDYLVRNLMGIDVDQGLVAIAETVSAGDAILFCRRDAQSAEEDLARMLEDVRRRLPHPPRGALYHSCLARGPNQFGPDSAELRQVCDVLGDVPLVGFFANGEISGSRLYSYTGVLTVFL